MRLEKWLRLFDAQCGGALCAEAAHVLRSWHRAEDVVQETLIKVWSRCASFRGDSQPMAWVRQVLRRTVLDVLRATHPEEPLEHDDGDLTPAAERAVASLSLDRVIRPDQVYEQGVIQQTYRQCWMRFARAHPEHAAVLRWVVEDGMEPADLAALLGRTPGATREYISQCRKKARPFLEEWRSLVSLVDASTQGDGA